MAYLRILIFGVFSFYICFYSAHSYAQSEFDPGAYETVRSEELARKCESVGRGLFALGGAAAEMAAECAQKVGSNIISGLGAGVKGAASTGMAVAKCVWSPIDCASEVAATARAFVDMMSQAVEKVTAMLRNIEPRQAAMMACEMIASAAARNLLRGGIPAILAGLTTNLARFAALGPSALYLQKLGVAIDAIVNIDRVVMDQVAKLGAVAKSVFAREMKMCPI